MLLIVGYVAQEERNRNRHADSGKESPIAAIKTVFMKSVCRFQRRI